jgi:hypothetical protein
LAEAVLSAAAAPRERATCQVTADDTATPVTGVWVTAADTDTITLNGGSQGGLIGDTIRLVDIATNQWVVHGTLKQSGTEATPFSATVV